MTSSLEEDQWVAIQHKTFVNWANEQLSLSNRSVTSLATDLCDGVRLVALVEALQLQKVGRVFAKPTSRIQMINNVGLALKAIQDDNVKLVNIGSDDIVGGNLKLILGLLWHLILRYQISSSKSKSPPKKLMLLWFQNAIPELTIQNFTSCWRDGIALHALLEYCKPGIAPNWRSLKPQDRVENCRVVMRLAKEQLGIPLVISPEDFASENLDELSSMTYLSYFIKKNSAGYYGVLNWACKQLKTANISNLTTSWNDGYQLCSLVQSLGGEVADFPDLDRLDHLGNCQKALDAAEKLGVKSIMTASDLCDPTIDHLAVMAYFSKLQRITPRKTKADKIRVDTESGQSHFVGDKISSSLSQTDMDVVENKVKVVLVSPDKSNENSILDVVWSSRMGSCKFIPSLPGVYRVQVSYDGVEIRGSPFEFKVVYDYKKVKVTHSSETCLIGEDVLIMVTSPFELRNSPQLTATSDQREVKHLTVAFDGNSYKSTFKPPSAGCWTVKASVDEQHLNPVSIMTFDPSKAKISGPNKVVTSHTITCSVSTRDCGTDDVTVTVEDSNGQIIDFDVQKKSDHIQDIRFPCQENVSFYIVMASVANKAIPGSPLTIEVVDPGKVLAFGDGLHCAAIGVEAFFRVNNGDVGGNVTATVDVDGYQTPISRERLNNGLYEFCFVPRKPGLYNIHVCWNDLPLKGSPYKTRVTDKASVVLQDDITELTDEQDRVALIFDTPTTLTFDVSQAGPDVMTAEMLTPAGKRSMDVHQDKDKTTVFIVARHEGLHYIHIYWGKSPLPSNPISAYCAGAPRPIDASKVILHGRGLTSARSLVPADFVIDGSEAGPGVPEVIIKGLHSSVQTRLTPLKYDRYRCTFVCPAPGSLLLYVQWSGDVVPHCPYKISVTPKGDPSLVKVRSEGLVNGFIIGQELRVYVDTSTSRPGDITATCRTKHSEIPCDVTLENMDIVVVRAFPSTAEKHTLSIQYDGDEVPGSPYVIPVSEVPDPEQVKVFGPGIEHGLLDRFESRFIVDTHGAGAGQLAVKIKGPRGGFRVDMSRESDEERIITCRYDPVEPGEYMIYVRWSGVEVPGSPFSVQLVMTMERLNSLLRKQGLDPYYIQHQWRAEI